MALGALLGAELGYCWGATRANIGTCTGNRSEAMHWDHMGPALGEAQHWALGEPLGPALGDIRPELGR
jgi:hypothetical protein